ncbi:hypothetical protein Tco_1264383 [Tanacetum coccineum]
MGLLRTELEKVKQEKEGFEFKIAKFEKSAKDLDQLLASQITDKSKKGFGYNVVPSPHPLILNRPTPLDLSYSGLEEFKEPESGKGDLMFMLSPQHVGLENQQSQWMHHRIVLYANFERASIFCDDAPRSVPDAQIQDKYRLQDEKDATEKSHEDSKPKRVSKALSDPAWVEAMQEELLQFKLQKVWILVDLPKGHREIGYKVQQKKKRQMKSVKINMFHEILIKYNYTDVKPASTPTDLEKPLVQDGDAVENEPIFIDSDRIL